MRSHFWLLIVTVAVCATVSYGELKMPLADDPLFNKMLATTEDNKPEPTAVRAPIRKPMIQLADDPR